MTAFTAITIEEIADEKPSRLRLAIACRELRRTATFRPSIAEILCALDDARSHARRYCALAETPTYLANAKRLLKRLSERRTASAGDDAAGRA